MLTDKHFIDWENECFGYGYGTGETYIIQALKDFMSFVSEKAYNYKEVEEKLGATVTWLLINILCKADIIDYGTSPRYGWLTKKGCILKEYLMAKDTSHLVETTRVNEDYTPCDKEVCNCEGHDCDNPLW